VEWFPGGPKLGFILMPIPDPECAWGNESCSKCNGFCAGHYLKPDQTLTSDLPPSYVSATILFGKRFSSVFKWKGTFRKYAERYCQEVYAYNK